MNRRQSAAGGFEEPPLCEYFEAHRCRSCTLIETPYARQLRDKEERCRALLPSVAADAWLPSLGSDVRDFRNKAKLVVGGDPGAVTLGILGPDGEGVDLRDCLIQAPAIRAAIPRIAAFIERTGLVPYDVPRRRGELKFVHVTASVADAASGVEAVPMVDAASSVDAAPMADPASGVDEAPGAALMLRFVTRSEQGLARLRKALPGLRAAVPEAAVVSVNLLPEHKAVLEGEREELLLGSSLDMRLGVAGEADLSLHLLPRSFFQTNTAVARALYAQAAEWIGGADPASLWDLYCGVGGFALHCAGRGSAGEGDGSGAGDGLGKGSAGAREVLGVEISESAVRSARRSAREAGIEARFVAADATAFALAARPEELPEAVIVNPPRRGIGADLAAWLETSQGIRNVVYSSCNPESLARDLAAMPSLEVRAARVFDMFPHTRHMEVAVLLERSGSGPASR